MTANKFSHFYYFFLGAIEQVRIQVLKITTKLASVLILLLSPCLSGIVGPSPKNPRTRHHKYHCHWCQTGVDIFQKSDRKCLSNGCRFLHESHCCTKGSFRRLSRQFSFRHPVEPASKLQPSTDEEPTEYCTCSRVQSSAKGELHNCPASAIRIQTHWNYKRKSNSPWTFNWGDISKTNQFTWLGWNPVSNCLPWTQNGICWNVGKQG